MRTKSLLNPLITLSAGLLLMPVATQAATMGWENNNFDSGLGNWDIFYNNTANGNNVGWLNSNNAGGTAGELGGTFARHTSSAFVGRYLGTFLTLNDAMHWKGVFSSTNTYRNWNNSVYIGYFNTAEALADSPDSYVGWRNREPNTGATTGDPYRSRARINVLGTQLAQLSSPNLTYNQGQSYAFDVQWAPSGLGDGSGTFSGAIGPFTFTQAIGAQANLGSFDAFGIWWDESAIDPTVKFDAYFDNLEYLVPVPEPCSGLLALLGFAGLWLSKRVRGSRR